MRTFKCVRLHIYINFIIYEKSCSKLIFINPNKTAFLVDLYLKFSFYSI